MAQRGKAYAGQAAGAFFVDSSCIDCGTCYEFAPDTFQDAGGHSRVQRQPEEAASLLQASMALLACPTASIGTDDKSAMAGAARAFPALIEDEVGFCGYTSEASFGAWSYLIQRPGGNVLMDSPRAAQPLVKRLEELGGLRWMVLSHQDDVADHQAFHDRFHCERVMHAGDRMGGMERYIEGEDPVALAPDLLLIPTPGHTAGSMCLLYRETFLFTGDHLWWNPDRGMLSASRTYNWHSWPRQLRSLEKLLDFNFRWVLPGHGSSLRAESPAAMRAELERALDQLRKL
ncbi:MAG TPA: MBL fold metallo-hydrolase [Holophagaceae bacterium]|nr:MBL fold metallo-hydrolase [Holophagaceae bacterium]